MPDVTVLIIDNGPLKVMGGVAVVDDASGGTVPGAEADAVFLCRCGRSSNKPFCDGTHKRVGFDGTLTAMQAAGA
jgi:CDGSH-type Zn-finger protein